MMVNLTTADISDSAGAQMIPRQRAQALTLAQAPVRR